jgi:large subunit ribosomal protein L9
MKVILKRTVPKLGKQGQVVNVKPGYARNFLFPQGMAVFADRGQMKALEMQNARMAAKLAETRADAEKVSAKVNGLRLVIQGRSGDTGKLFGAITSPDVVDAVKKASGVELDRRQVLLLQPIKQTGTHVVELDIHRDLDVSVSVVVYDPEREAEPAAVAAVAEEAPAAEEEA